MESYTWSLNSSFIISLRIVLNLGNNNGIFQRSTKKGVLKIKKDYFKIKWIIRGYKTG